MALSICHNLNCKKTPFAFQSQIIPSSKPNINCSQLLQFPSIQCSSSSNHKTSSINLRTCKNCKTQFDPQLNHPLACRFHTAHFGGTPLFFSYAFMYNPFHICISLNLQYFDFDTSIIKYYKAWFTRS